MKKNDILVAANQKVAEYLALGFILSWGDSSFGADFRVDLERGDEHVRVYVEGEICRKDYLDTVTLKVVKIDSADAFESKDREPLYKKVYYAIKRCRDSARLWYVDSKEEALEARRKVTDRYDNREAAGYCVTPTAAFIRRLKNRAGYSNATRNNIEIYRSEVGYMVSIRNREGRVTRADVFKFKNR